MGNLRFYRRKQIVPGVRLNFSKSGPSISLGPRGAHSTIGPHGERTTVGIPGTGLYYTTSGRRRAAMRQAVHHGAAPEAHPIVHMLVNLVRVLVWLVALVGVAVIAAGCVSVRAVRGAIRARRS